MRTIGWLFASVFALSGCLFDSLPDRPGDSMPDVEFLSDADGSSGLASDSMPFLDAPFVPPDTHIETTEIWPRSHPTGTLLVDHANALWMVAENGVRKPVSGSVALENIGKTADEALRMTTEEERCLLPAKEYWIPPNLGWWPVYGPDEADLGPFVVKWDARTRHRVSLEALESYGYFWRWLDSFDAPGDAWSMLTEGDPIGILDGTLVHTEHGFYYVMHNRSFPFETPGLVTEAGYHAENALWMRDSRLRELAPASITFTHDTFSACPADEAGAP